jgi:hypothetical protein
MNYSISEVPFEFRDISKSGTLLNVTRHGLSDPIPLGFGFSFFGKKYSEVSIAACGLVTFSPAFFWKGQTKGDPVPLKKGTARNFVAGLWDYLVPNSA